MRRLAGLLLMTATLAGCGGGARHTSLSPRVQAGTASVASTTTSVRPRRHSSAVWALVPAETQSRLYVVGVPGGRVLRSIAVPAGPEYVAARPGLAVVTDKVAGTVTMLEGDPLRVRRVLRGFATPQIVSISPGDQYAYVTDGARGDVTVIRLRDLGVTAVVPVGASAHHMGFSPDGSRLWVALGESARTIVRLDTTNIEHPRVVGRFDPGFAAHDLLFSPSGRQVWISSASGPDVSAFSAAGGRLLFRIPVGPPPQHIAFEGAVAYLTSGYGSTIEEVSTATGKVLHRARTPYGSFELDADGRFVVTASLLDGRLGIYTPALRRLRVVALAPATRDVALASP